MKSKILIIGILILALQLIIFCGGSQVRNEDVNNDQADDVGFSGKDLNEICEYMLKSVMDSAFYKEYIAQEKEKRQLFILAPKLENKTTQHIDSRGIIEKLRTQLINRGSIRFIDEKSIDDAMKQLELQSSDFFDNKQALRLGKLVGGRYLLRGSMREIAKRTDLKDKSYFMITLWIVDLETTEMIWTDEKEYQRVKEKSKFTL